MVHCFFCLFCTSVLTWVWRYACYVHLCRVVSRWSEVFSLSNTRTRPTLFRFTRADLLTAYECCTCRYRPALVRSVRPRRQNVIERLDWWFQTSRWVACVLFHVQQRHLLVSRASTFICFISFGGFKTQKRLFLIRSIIRNTDSGSAKRLLLRCFPSKYWLRQRKKTNSYF